MIVVLLVSLFPIAVKKYTLCFVLNLSQGVVETIGDFKEYKENSAKRNEKLQKLASQIKSSDEKGVYVLVIGESATRNHMSAYGYGKQTTPFLDQLKKEGNTLVFENTWSNETYTIATLQYALTGQNQYNQRKLSDVYSLSEIATVAGFDTYWISNQTPFRSGDIPIVIFARATSSQTFINQHTGKGIFSDFYDEKLIDVFPNINSDGSVFIIVHLIGSHPVYLDRYPKKFEHFKDEDLRVSSYDNSILYTDYVMSKLYRKLVKIPNFMALVYFSDHGEEPDLHYGHDGARYTPQMSKIPLVMSFSEEFKKKNPKMFETLKSHQKVYWSNDLLYDVMVSVLGLRFVPDVEAKYDLSSEEYDMPLEKLLTCHGKRKVMDGL